MVDRIKCLCSDVESRHDRLKASVADYDGFCKNRDKWISNIRGGVHFIEDLVFTRFTKTDVNQQLRLLGILDDKVVEERYFIVYNVYKKNNWLGILVISSLK